MKEVLYQMISKRQYKGISRSELAALVRKQRRFNSLYRDQFNNYMISSSAGSQIIQTDATGEKT